jgi:hypothetical protein
MVRYAILGISIFSTSRGKNKMTQAQTLSVPEAGRLYFGLCRNASYAAVARNEIPVIRIGKLLRVPVRALEQMLDTAMKTSAA